MLVRSRGRVGLWSLRDVLRPPTTIYRLYLEAHFTVSMSNGCASRWCFCFFRLCFCGVFCGPFCAEIPFLRTEIPFTVSVLSVAYNCTDTNTEGTYERVLGCGAHPFDMLTRMHTYNWGTGGLSVGWGCWSKSGIFSQVGGAGGTRAWRCFTHSTKRLWVYRTQKKSATNLTPREVIS
jgi:hypothetical protein